MGLLLVYFNFIKIGLFTIGGGLAALALLQDFVLSNGWLTINQFADMIAVSQSTPGPIGINMSTYIGFSQYGVLGGVIATLGMVTPSWIIIILIARFIGDFSSNRIVQSIFVGLRPVVLGIIFSAAWSIALLSIFNNGADNLIDFINFKALIMFVCLVVFTRLVKLSPIFYVIIGGLVGILIF